MFSFTRRQCRLTALALLTLFVSALGLMGACAVWCGPMHGTSGVVAVASTPTTGAHSCCARKAADKQRKQSKQAECCAHEKAAKLAAVPDGSFGDLGKLATPVLALPPGALSWQPGRLAGAWGSTLAVRLVPPRHLPPRIPDIRVFLHSLIV